MTKPKPNPVGVPPGMRDLNLRDHFAINEKSEPPGDWIADYFNEKDVNSFEDLTPERAQEALAVWRYECADVMLKIRSPQE